MKTLSQILVIAGMATLVACGPSAEQKAEQARLDSIRVADSIAVVEAEAMRVQDSINAVAAEQQRIADSIAALPVKK
ncbi:MAG: hypothetical protein IPH20_02065 [Bacteroidales bacterium]|jgi:hypothetical protein|nr:hypothetical protein [Bacteroidales bacterium]